ncbi:hypothetical protein Tco_1002000 [Tanacetum coccineum]|uniref:Uncharacterized protein n=1 Tax=Tanacetum coccineum TaxID=301880 RepID=A0ABQ5F6W5_9ASTR
MHPYLSFRIRDSSKLTYQNAKSSLSSSSKPPDVWLKRVIWASVSALYLQRKLQSGALEEEEERQRIAMVHEATSSFNVEEWEDIQARVQADEELVQSSGSSKRAAEEELDQESSKRQKTGESSELAEEPRDKEADELSQEELQQMMIIVPEQGMNVEALQTNASCVYREGNRHYMLCERKKYYPCPRGTLHLIWSPSSGVDRRNEMSKDCLRKAIFM